MPLTLVPVTLAGLPLDFGSLEIPLPPGQPVGSEHPVRGLQRATLLPAGRTDSEVWFVLQSPPGSRGTWDHTWSYYAFAGLLPFLCFFLLLLRCFLSFFLSKSLAREFSSSGLLLGDPTQDLEVCLTLAGLSGSPTALFLVSCDQHVPLYCEFGKRLFGISASPQSPKHCGTGTGKISEGWIP